MMLAKSEHSHWSVDIGSYLLESFSINSQDNELFDNSSSNQLVLQLFERLGNALDMGHTVVRLTEVEKHSFADITHSLIYVVQDDLNGYASNHITAKPIVINNGLAYLHRQWHQESSLAHHLLLLTEYPNKNPNISEERISDIDLSHLPDSMHPQQRLAVEKAINNGFTLITGGPGTGKTWTVAQLVITLLRDNPTLKIALAAPTGKAAQRMQEALEKGIQSSLTATDKDELLGVTQRQLDQAKTVHKLIGLGFGTQPRFHANNPLPYDLVIIDEASMLGVALANQLISAIGTDTKIIMLGDANQLSAVDAGAVLADLCHSGSLADYHVSLTQSKRFSASSGVGKLAQAVLQNQTDIVSEILATQPNIAHIDTSKPINDADTIYHKMWQGFGSYTEYLKTLHKLTVTDMLPKITKLFVVFDEFRVLTDIHAGRFGDNQINLQLSNKLKQFLDVELGLANTNLTKSSWFHGRPVMMLKNDYQLGLSNGDIGITLQDDEGQFHVFFPQYAQPFSAHRLAENNITTAFAMTIHKSQGSEYRKVAIVLECYQNSASKADNERSLLSRELIYTAITRAKESVDLYADLPTILHSVATKAVRQTGLSELLAKQC